MHAAASACPAHVLQFVEDWIGGHGASRPRRQTPLHYASKYKNLDAIRTLVAMGADIDKSDCHGRTPLHCAARFGHADAVELLLSLGSQALSARTRKGRTPLMCCEKSVFAADNSVFELLSARYPELVDDTDNMGMTSMHYTVTCCDASIVDMYHQAGSRAFTIKAHDGSTPMHRAAACGNAEVFEALQRYGGDVDAVDNNGRTPMHIAACGRCNKNNNICKLTRLGSIAYWMKDVYGKRPRDYITYVDIYDIERHISSLSTLATLRLARKIYHLKTQQQRRVEI